MLASEPENAEALHRFGVLHHQHGDHGRAVELIGRAVALRPNAYLYHANLAEAYRAAGDLERAAECCRAALRLWPDYPEALCNLGLALPGAGDAREAVESLRRAVELRPDFVVAHNNLGIALRELGQARRGAGAFPPRRRARSGLRPGADQPRPDAAGPRPGRGGAAALPGGGPARARPAAGCTTTSAMSCGRWIGSTRPGRLYLEALRLDPDLAPANAHLGLILQREGQLAEAVPWLKRAVELDPDDADFWEWLAELHDERDEPAEAIPCWERVLALEPGAAGRAPLAGLGLAGGRAAGRGPRALPGRRSSSSPTPARPQLNLGGLHEELGEMDRGRGRLPRRAAAASRTSRCPTPGWRRCCAASCPTPTSPRSKRRLADRRAGPGPRARLLFGLAHVLDARGDYARAADCLREANALTLGAGRADAAIIVPAEHERFVDGLLRAFDRGFFARLAGAGLDTRRPVFVFGLPRSGTTLIEQVLASHSRIHGAGELRWPGSSFEAIPAVAGPDRAAAATASPSSTRPALRRLAEQHLEQLDGHRRRPADRGSWTRCPTTTCTSACWPSCSPAPRSSTAAATCATWPSRAG